MRILSLTYEYHPNEEKNQINAENFVLVGHIDISMSDIIRTIRGVSVRAGLSAQFNREGI